MSKPAARRLLRIARELLAEEEPTIKAVAQKALQTTREKAQGVDGVVDRFELLGLMELMVALQLIARSPLGVQPFRQLTNEELKAHGAATGPLRDAVKNALLAAYAFEFGRGGNPSL